MGVYYLALGKTTWQAFKLEDGLGARGPQLKSIDELGDIPTGDLIYTKLCYEIFGEYRYIYLPRNLLKRLLEHFAEENPDGVEIWASDSISVYDEPEPGSFGWLNGNRDRKPIEYIDLGDMWEMADRYLPELYEPENMKEVFGDMYEPYIKRKAQVEAEAKAKALEQARAPIVEQEPLAAKKTGWQRLMTRL